MMFRSERLILDYLRIVNRSRQKYIERPEEWAGWILYWRKRGVLKALPGSLGLVGDRANELLAMVGREEGNGDATGNQTST